MAEHMLQFGVFIDDDAIQRHVEDKVAEKVIEEMTRKQGRFGMEPSMLSFKVDEVVREKVSEVVGEHRQEIVRTAVDKLVASASKSKAFKDALSMRIMSIPTEELMSKDGER